MTRARALSVLALTVGLSVVGGDAWAQQAYEIHTYGNGAMVRSALEGISAFTNVGGGFHGALRLGALVGFLGMLVAMAGSLAGGAMNYVSFAQAAVVAGAVATLGGQGVNVAVFDRVNTDDTAIVQNVPLPIAIIGHLSSVFGVRLTERVEEVIMPVDSQRFSTRGLGWGPRVLAGVMDTQIHDRTLLADLIDYIRVCVTYDVNTFHKTAETISKATTIDAILDDTNPAIPYVLPSQQPNPPQDQSCPQAYVNNLRQRLDDEANSEAVKRIFAMRVGLRNWADAPTVISDIVPELVDVSQSATELLKLRFVTNALLPSVHAFSDIGGQPGAVTAWALAEAQAQQSSAWLTTGLLLQQVLPVFHAALEFLWYAFLLIGIPLLMVIPRLLFHMMATALWLQLWPLAYVFGNLFLYSKVNELSPFTGDAGQGWGLSLASTQPIHQTIQGAYAASGFPVMVGVIMLGAMIFGGSYGIHKAISAGPWGAGGGFGSAAALGNVTMGNMSLEQRTLSPMTQRAQDGQIVRTDYDAHYHPVGSRAWAGATIDIQASSGRYTEGASVGGAAGYAQVEFGGGVQAAFDPRSGRSIAASLPVSARTNESAVTQAGNALTLATQRVQQQQTRLENARAGHVDRLYRTTLSSEASEQAGISEGTREAFQRQWQQNVENVLTSGKTGQELRQRLIQNAASANLGVSGAPTILGFSLGAGGQLTVRSQFQHGEEVHTTLSRQESARILSEGQDSLARTTEYQTLRQEVERHGGASERALGFTEVQRETRDYSDAVSRQNRAETVVRATQEFAAMVGAERAHLFVNSLWDQMNPGVNMQQAFKQNALEAQTFSAYLKTALSTPEGIQELSTQALDHLKTTGQLDQLAAQDRYIADEMQRIPAPSAAGLKAASDPLLGSKYVEPLGHKIGPIKEDVASQQQAVRQELQMERQALHEARGRLKDAPMSQEVERGIAEREAKTHGGPLTAAVQAGKEAAEGVGRDVAKGVSEVGKQFGAGLKWLHEKNKETVEHGFEAPVGP